MPPKRLHRSRTEKMIAGVCGGIAEYLGMDPTVVRVLWVLVAFLAGSGLLLYLVLWIIIPLDVPGSSGMPPAGSRGPRSGRPPRMR